LSSHKIKIIKKHEELSKRSKKYKDAFNEKMKYLGSHQALDVYSKVNKQLTDLQIKYDNLVRYSDLIQGYKDAIKEEKADMATANVNSDEYLLEISDYKKELSRAFNNYSQKFYPESVSGISISNNEGENQIRFDVEAKIQSDGSDGINNVKILCYDLLMLTMKNKHAINFLFHDSRLFDGVDELHKAEMFKVLHQDFFDSDYQYIATVNQNQLEEIKNIMGEDDYKNVIENNTILTLTDSSDADKLLGIKVEL
jgi:uncharacterized protein YydD (DUF2326 family)